MSEYFRFAAFISYSSQDRAFAERLMKRLENYEIPNRLGEFDITGAGKKNRVYPIFKDREELSAGALDDQLKAALRASANLIVISSENAKRSKWVDLEIEYFASLGKQDKIFAIITPDSGEDKDANTELFPEKLIELFGVPLAADARPAGDGFRNALLKLVAGAVSLNAGKLQDRDRKRRRERALAWTGGLTAVAAIAAAGIWAFALPTYTYAKDYVRVFGKLTPVDIVSADQAARRQKTIRFKKYGRFGSVSLMEFVNSAGNCSNSATTLLSLTGDAFKFKCNAAKACAIKQLYENGQVSGEEVRDQVGNVLERVSYRPGSNQAIREEAVVGCSRLDNGIKYIEIDRSEREETLGYDQAFRFFSAPGVPRANSEFSYGYLEERDNGGRLLRRTTISKDGAPTLNKNGFSILATSYNATGNKIEIKILDEQGQLTDASRTAARRTFEYDRFGNDTLEQKFTANGSANTDKGYHAKRFTYDQRGNLSSVEFLDPSLRLVPTENGVARKNYQYNQDGFFVEVTHSAANPNENVGVCAHEKFERTQHGLQKSGACFTSERDPTLYEWGYHRWVAERDDKLNVIANEYYAADGSPALTAGGYFRRENIWNELGQKVASIHFDPDLEPAINREGIHKWVDEFDANGYRVRSSTYDDKDNPVYDNDSVFRYEWERDDYGQIAKSAPYDINGNLIDKPTKHYKTKRDEFGNVTQYSYLNPAGEVSNASAGFAVQKRQHDHQGRLSEVRFFDQTGEPVQGWFGAYIVRYKYNNLGKTLETHFLDDDERPMLSNNNAAYERYIYDDLGHALERLFFDIDDQPTNSTYGAHRIVWDKDVFDQIQSAQYFDKDGNPAVNTQSGYHGWSNVWNTRGKLIEQTSYDTDWEPFVQVDQKFATRKWKFDDLNRRIETRYFDADGSAIQNQWGVYGTAFAYDSNNRVIKETYLGADGQPKAAAGSKTAFETKQYDALGNVIENAFFEEDGTPISEFAAIEKLTRDRFGNLLLTEGFGPDGDRRPLQTTGRASAAYTYDDLGNTLTEESFDPLGRPFNRVDKKWFRKIYDRSSSGALLSEKCFTTEAAEVPCDS